jgi:hypothetical protein
LAIDIQSKTTTVFDYSIFGGINSKGEINQVWGSDALANSLLMWISSFKGDIIRNPLAGGIFTNLITKPMTQTNVINTQRNALKFLNNEFSPILQDIKITTEPNFEKHFWLVSISAWSPDIKDSVYVSTRIKNQSGT